MKISDAEKLLPIKLSEMSHDMGEPAFHKGQQVAHIDSPREYIGRVIKCDDDHVWVKDTRELHATGHVTKAFAERKYPVSQIVPLKLR